MRKPNLSDDERHRIVCLLFESCKNQKPAHGKVQEVAATFNVSRRCISKIWTAAQKQREQLLPINVRSKIPGKTGKDRLPCPIEEIMALDVSKRSTLKRLGLAIGHAPSTCRRWVKQGVIKSHTNAIKPDLTQDQKHLRLHFTVDKLVFDRLLRCLKFKDMSHVIHIDEKWFYMTKPSCKYYIGSNESEPYRSCKSKRYITKVMFLAAVLRLIYEDNGDVLFDGKLGIWPFIYQEPAKRNSKNRVTGTMVTKAIESITKQVTKETLINLLIPAIKQKWPASASKEITIQQDNAKPHLNGKEKDFIEAATSDGFNIKLTQQPAMSPDLNILDLGFFRVIQSLQDENPAKNVEELVKIVQDAYERETVECLDNVWLSLQACMVEIMKMKGYNNYKLPHLKKAAQRRQGTLPRDLVVDEELVKKCIQFLITCGLITDLGQLMLDLGIQVPF
ncbi:hypothetical protein RND81_02G191600 [Saponaria officinalis]|uniref:DUF7769 domain-containing protein n=1 Tax=Saponaria officinalis TaxID=3572 RepID=A0AAW1MW17_SAPOF